MKSLRRTFVFVTIASLCAILSSGTALAAAPKDSKEDPSAKLPPLAIRTDRNQPPADLPPAYLTSAECNAYCADGSMWTCTGWSVSCTQGEGCEANGIFGWGHAEGHCAR